MAAFAQTPASAALRLWIALPRRAASALHALLAPAALLLKPRLRARLRARLGDASPFLAETPRPARVLRAVADEVHASARILASLGTARRDGPEIRLVGEEILERLAAADSSAPNPSAVPGHRGGEEPGRKARAAQAPFVVLFGIHQGLWELLPGAIAARGLAVHVPAARLKCGDDVVRALRAAENVEYFPGNELPLKIRALARGERPNSGSATEPASASARSASPNGMQDTSSSRHVLALLVDQPGPNCKETVSLFGRERVWWSAPLRTAKRCGAAIVPFSVSKEGDGAKIELFPPLEGDPEEMGPLSAKWAEARIQADPASWVWYY